MSFFVDDLTNATGNLNQSTIYKPDLAQFLYWQDLDHNVSCFYLFLIFRIN